MMITMMIRLISMYFCVKTLDYIPTRLSFVCYFYSYIYEIPARGIGADSVSRSLL
jgi:hypothetical protein